MIYLIETLLAGGLAYSVTAWLEPGAAGAFAIGIISFLAVHTAFKR